MTSVSTPTGTNTTAQVGDTVVSEVVKTGLSIGETLLFADLPGLALPGLKQLVQLLLKFLSGYVLKGLSQVVVFDIIDSQVKGEETDFNKALAALKAAQAAGNPDATQAALKNFQAAAQNLGHSDGSAIPR